METVKAALAQYGAELTPEGHISRSNVTRCFVKVIIKGKRLRFESGSGLIASGPITAKFVEDFVERFWYWEKS